VTASWWGADRRVAPGPLATLADVAMGMALRSRYPGAVRFATMGLDIQHAGYPAAGRVGARASLWGPAGPLGLARAELTDGGGRPVALASGLFVRRPLPAGAAPPELEPARSSGGRATGERLTAELSADERRFLGDLARALARQRGAPDAYAAYLGLEALAAGDGEVELAMPLDATTANVVGHAQGGVVYGLAAQAAIQVAGGRLGQLSLRFLRPGAGRRLRARARVIRSGRETAIVACEVLTDEGALAATALGCTVRG
jgi:acyl-CoA thioesterase